MKYYIDTCIWIDYWENRTDNLRPLGEFAFNFFSKLEDGDIVYYSYLTIKELRNKYSDETITKIFSIVDEYRLIYLESDANHFKMAEAIARTGLAHKSDALHVVLAKEFGAKLITRDTQILLSGLVEAFAPEDLI